MFFFQMSQVSIANAVVPISGYDLATYPVTATSISHAHIYTWALSGGTQSQNWSGSVIPVGRYILEVTLSGTLAAGSYVNLVLVFNVAASGTYTPLVTFDTQSAGNVVAHCPTGVSGTQIVFPMMVLIVAPTAANTVLSTQTSCYYFENTVSTNVINAVLNGFGSNGVTHSSAAVFRLIPVV